MIAGIVKFRLHNDLHRGYYNDLVPKHILDYVTPKFIQKTNSIATYPNDLGLNFHFHLVFSCFDFDCEKRIELWEWFGLWDNKTADGGQTLSEQMIRDFHRDRRTWLFVRATRFDSLIGVCLSRFPRRLFAVIIPANFALISQHFLYQGKYALVGTKKFPPVWYFFNEINCQKCIH